ncbi:MAG: sulfite exporter TauE/SafE family protein [Candidatus Marinimicrobia bacterium]|nr:sulfite exporter TauE/SafE family protein [Candidatus Neomarinimicrobiota bacterium]
MGSISILQLSLAYLAVFLGAFVQGSIGFGMAMIAAPLLMLIHTDFIPGPILLASLLTSIMVSFRERQHSEIGKIKWMILGRIFGNLIGAGVIVYISVEKFTILFGILVIIAVLLSASGLHIPISLKNMIFAGLLSGFMGTTVSIGGPPAALLFQHEKGPQFRATMANYFLIGVILSLLSLAAMGKFGFKELFLGFCLLPGVFLGVYMSQHLTKKLDQQAIRPYVLGLSGISGLLAIVKVLIF